MRFITHKIPIKPLSKVFGSPAWGVVEPSDFGLHFSEALPKSEALGFKTPNG
jgi:hypothetical protein